MAPVIRKLRSKAVCLHCAVYFPLFAVMLGIPQMAAAGAVGITGPDAYLTYNVKSYKDMVYYRTIKQKYDFSCGSAALATLLTYHYGDPVTEAQAFSAMWKAGEQAKIRREGFSLFDMKQYLEANGYSADGFHFDLKRLAEIGVPAIVLINDEGYNHFVVIKGIMPDLVLYGDSAKGIKITSREKFAQMWKGIAFLIRSKADQGRQHFNLMAEWKTVLKAPMYASASRNAISDLTLFVRGPDEF